MSESALRDVDVLQRPPRERIQEILDHRHYDIQHRHMRYAARRDHLQLCAEIDHLRVIERRYQALVEKRLMVVRIANNRYGVYAARIAHALGDVPTPEGKTPEEAIDAALLKLEGK